jgi:hypothetical protein
MSRCRAADSERGRCQHSVYTLIVADPEQTWLIEAL